MNLLRRIASPVGSDHLARRRDFIALAALGSLGGACSPATMAPSVEFTELNGAQRDTASLRGKVSLINFWATSCATCVAEMPDLSALYQRHRTAGYETLAVAMSYDPPAYVATFAERRGLPFPVVIDNTGAIAKAFGDIRLTPTTFLLDKQTRIVKRYVGTPDFKALDGLIRKLLEA